MRVLIFAILITLFSCGSDSKSTTEQQQKPTTKEPSKDNVINSSTVEEDGIALNKLDDSAPDIDASKNYKKTASTFSEFAVYKTLSFDGTSTEYFFKTLDGISLEIEVPIEGEPKVKVPDDLLEHAKYQEGHPGANPNMVGKVFEIIYDSDNVVAEVKLAETE